MQFLQHRHSNIQTQTINKLSLGDFEGARGEADLPEWQEPPLEDLEAVGDALLDDTSAENIRRIINTAVPEGIIGQGVEARAEGVNLPSVMPALPTLFMEDGAIDFQAQEDLMRHLAQQGIRGFVVKGTTGESSLVTFQEHQAAVAHAVQTARAIETETGENISIVAGSGANWTAEQHHLSLTAMQSKADANLLLPPYYIREQSPGNMLRHFWTALEEGPGIVYRVEARSGRKVPLPVIEQLMRHENFLGVKECDGKVSDLVGLFENSNRELRVWSGEDGEVVRDREAGAYGSISVTANLHPELVLTANDREQTGYAVDRTAERITRLLFHPEVGSPSTVHAAREMQYDRDRIRGFRSPCLSITPDQRAWLKSSLNQVGVTDLRDFSQSRVRNFLRHTE